MKLLKLRKNTFYINGFANVGVIANEQGEALLVDAGLDERAARRIKAILDKNGLTAKGIVITHAHADHYGGAAFFARLGTRIYASGQEKAVIETPIWEAVCLFGGAFPPAELRRKYFHAPRTPVHGVISPGAAIIEGFPVEIVDLSGHTMGQIGVAADQVLFCADAVATPDQMQKQAILKNTCVEHSLQTLSRLKARTELVFVPAHGNICHQIAPLADENEKLISNILIQILHLTREPIGVEELLTRICDRQEANIKSLSQYYVLHLSLLAYLRCLMDEKQIVAVYENNKQSFKRQ